MPRTLVWQGTLVAALALLVPGPVLAGPDGAGEALQPMAAASQAQAKPDDKPAAVSAAPVKPAQASAVPAPAPEPAAKTAVPEPAAESGAAAAASVEAEPGGAKAQAKLSAEQLAALREESSQLIDEMSQARAKAALLGKTLFKTQLRLRVQNLAAPDPRLVKIELKLDGAPVYVGDGTTLTGDDARQVFEGFIAPGRHVLTASLKQQSREDATFGYNLHDSYHFKVQRDKLSELTLIVDDDSDMASDYPDDGDGEYDVRLKLRVRTKNIGEE
jgi:hypothetical protein